MSSISSINSCMSPDVTSSNVSSNKLNGSIVTETSVQRIRSIVPEITKDNKYWERRRRNNEAARRSREKRRMNDMNMDHRVMELSQRNKLLEQELFQIKIGNVSTNQNTLFESQNKKSKITPIIPSTDGLKNKSTQSHVNGMVFPIFTTIKPVNSGPNITEPSNSHRLLNPSNDSSISIKNDNNIFQTNVLTFSNIPLLSSIIAAPNHHEDVTAKPTLLLPPFQFPPKILDQSNKSDEVILTTPNTAFVSSFKSYTKTEAVDFGNICPGDIKVDLADILDLRMKPENGDHLHNFSNGLPSLIGAKVNTAQNVKEESDHINNKFFCFDDTLDNSFLSVHDKHGKDHLSDVKQFNQVETKQSFNNFRRTKLSYGNKISLLRTHRKPKICPSFEYESRLQLRKEVVKIVRKENRKVHDAILCLSDEIKHLTSVLLPVVRSLAHVIPMVERSTCISQDPPNDP